VAILPVIDLGALWVGDVPQSPTRADFVDEAGNNVQISGYNSWSAYMLSPVGEELGELTGSEQGQHLNFTWPTTTILETPGIHTIVITFFDTNGVEVQCEPWKFVVQAIDGWLTLEQARGQWADAPLDDIFLYQLLETARAQCEEYAPALQLGAVVPARYIQAQLTQARALYQSTIANQADNVGIEGFTVRVFPLDFTIRAMLRPKKAIGGMF
jgi:hypothetical protein